MPDQIQHFLNETFGAGILNAVGPIPFAGTSWTPSSGGPSLDANAVGSEILGANLNLLTQSPDRNAILAALTNAFPATKDATGKPVVAYTGGAILGATASPGAIVGPLAVPAVSLQALSNFAEHALGTIKPFDPSSNGGCGYEPIVALIRSTIHELNRQFATGAPNEHEVDAFVEALVGSEDGADPGDDRCVSDGYLADLQKRCGIDFKRACSPEQEKIATSFMSLFSLTASFAGFWRSMRDADDGGFFLNEVQDLQRHLYASLTIVNRLRTAVPYAHWSIVEIGSNPPIVASKLWEWMQNYVGKTALELLRQGPDGKRSVHCTMSRFETILAALNATDAKDPDPNNPCAALPSPCDDDKVRSLTRELHCHVQRVVEATRARPRAYDEEKTA